MPTDPLYDIITVMSPGSDHDAGIDAESRDLISRLKQDEGGRLFWSDQNIETVLRELADRLGRFPTDQEIHDYGLGGARSYIREKGLAYWGEKIGYQPRRQGEWLPEQRKAAKIWTDRVIEDRLRELHQGKEMLMGTEELRTGKYPGLVRAIADKGRSYWAEKLGLETLLEQWDEQMLVAYLGEFLKGRSRFPSQKEFRDAGELKLHAALRRHHGIDHWVAWSGLPKAKAGRPKQKPGEQRKAPARWTEQSLGAYLDKFMDGWDHFPSQREFKEAGQGRLLDAMRNHKGVDHWIARSGLPRATNAGCSRSYSALR